MSSSYAQVPANQLEFGKGGSLKVGVIKTLLKQKEDLQLEGNLVSIFSYERRLHDVFALGASMTFQSFEGSYLYSVEQNSEPTEKISFTYKRRAALIEPKLYYPLKLEKFEIYTSVRIGLKQEKLDAQATNNTVNEVAKLADLLSVNPVNLSITPVGINFFPMKNLGIGLAGNIGPTYFTKGSLFLRF